MNDLPLALRHVHKAIAGRPVLRDVSMTCPPGSITALLGPNGAGKSTTVAIAVGLRRPDSGTSTVFGLPATSAGARRRFSLVPQEVGFPLTVNVDEVLDFVGGQRPPSELVPGRAELCDALGLSAVRRRAIGGLSGGQRRRVAVAAGMYRAPGLLLLDEATSNLDEQGRATVWRLTRDFTDRGGTALVTSHILADIESHADRVVAMSAGEVVLELPIEQVHDRLGGSLVSVRVPHDAAANLCGRVEAAALGERLSFESGPTLVALRWRSRRALSLTAMIAQAAPAASDLLVTPIPLDTLLSELAEPSVSAAPANPAQRKTAVRR